MEQLFAFALLALFTLSARFAETSAACKLLPTPEVTEYSCEGGQISDLDTISSGAEKILIANMTIPRLPADALQRFGRNLLAFGCSHCGIQEIDPDAFKAVIYIQQLTLDNNRLTSVKAEWFRGLLDLTYLDLSHNQIKEIEEETYAHLPRLVEFRLSGNLIECLDTKAMSGLQNLKRMFLVEISTFKCPRTASKFLAEKGIMLQKDETWEAIPPAEEEAFLYQTKSPSITKAPLKEPPTTERVPPIISNPSLYVTKPQPIEILTAIETFAPLMTSEDFDIDAVLTTNSLPKIPVESSSPKSVIPLVVVTKPTTEIPKPTVSPEVIDAKVAASTYSSIEECIGCTVIPLSSTVEPVMEVRLPEITEEPIIITPMKTTEIFIPPTPTLPPIYMPGVLPTHGEQPFPSNVVPITENAVDYPPPAPAPSGELYQEQRLEETTTEVDKPLPDCNVGTRTSFSIGHYFTIIIVALTRYGFL